VQTSETRARERWFAAIANVGLRRSGLVLAIAAAVVVLCGLLIPELRVTTSRYGLVSRENPYQARMLQFFDRFGYPDAPVILTSGGTADERREVIDRLVGQLEQEPALEGRVFGRLRPEHVAEVFLLHAPDALVSLRQHLPEDKTLSEMVGGGLPAWVGAIEQKLYAGLEGEGDPEQATEGLEQLATLARAFDTYLAGDDAIDAISGVADPTALRRPGLDEDGYLVAADGQYHVLTMFPELPGDEVEDLRPLVEQIREIRDQVMADATGEVVAEVTGLPALVVDERRLIERGLFISSFAAAFGILLLCYALFRSARQTIIALLPLLAGMVGTLAAVRFIYGELNLITSSFVAVLLGLGIDFSVHGLSRYNEQLRSGRTAEESIREALVHTGPGILTGAATTAIAFLTTVTTEFTAYAELGVVTAVGLLIIVVATFVGMPPLLLKAGKWGVKVAPEPAAVRHVPRLLRAAGVPLLVLGLLAGTAGALALPRIPFNARNFDFLPDKTESASALLKLEHDPLMSPIFAHVSADSVAEARVREAKLRALDSVAGLQTATDLLPTLQDGRIDKLRQGFAGLDRDPDFDALERRRTKPSELDKPLLAVIDALDEVRFALRQGDRDSAPAESAKEAFTALRARILRPSADVEARLAGLESDLTGLLRRAWTTARAVSQRGHYVPTDLPPLFQRRFVSHDGDALAVYVIPAGDFWDLEVAAAFVRDVESVDPGASGLAMNHHQHSTMIIEGFRRAALIAAVLIYVVLVLDFRSLRDAALAVVPAILGWLWMFGIMALVGIPFDGANIVCLPLVLGIGIAAGVHIMHRCRESAAQHGGRGRLDDIVRGTGGAVVIAGLTTMAGFGGLMLGNYGAMLTVGLALTVGVGACLVASILVLPPLLLALRRVD
jgi:hypothetical protein